MTVNEYVLTERQKVLLAQAFRYHEATDDQKARYQLIRAEAYDFAETILKLTPCSADQTAAIRLIRQAVSTAIDAIACNEPDDSTSRRG